MHVSSGGNEHPSPGMIESGGGHIGGGGQSGMAHWNEWPSHVHMIGPFVHSGFTIAGHCEPFTLQGEPGYVSSEQSSMGQSPAITGQSNEPFLHVHVSVVCWPQ